MSHQYIYVMKGLSKIINEQEVLKETWLSFIPGAKIGIIGPNGSGKSTLLKIMAGVDRAFHGEAWVAEGTRIGYLAQEPPLDTSKTVGENILDGLKYKTDILQKFNDISARLAEDLTEDEMCSLLEAQAELQEKIELLDAWNLDREIDIAMAALKCPLKDASVNQISGGEKRRVALCKLLLERPDMLLLDEPTNHLDAESVSWLENYLHTYKGTVVSITHDRYFLDNVAQWILEIDRGYCTPWHCNYSKWLELKEKKLSTEEKQESHRIKYLKRELEWIHQSPKARQSKNKARINSYHELLSKQDTDKKVGPAQIVIPNGPRLGDLVIEGNNISKTFHSKILFKDFNFKIPPGAIVGIIGPNGSGKSTLLNIIAGKEQVDDGEVKIGPTVKLGYVDQLREQLDANKTVWEEISGGLDEIYLGTSIVKSRAYCAAFNFRGADQQKKVGKLSGGERNRVNMAKLLREGANVILLDEPSNDLDVETLRSLEEAILDFAGCIIVVTHDRWFLDRIATHIIAFDNYGVTYIEGNYSDYYEYINKTQGVDSTIKYKHKKFM